VVGREVFGRSFLGADQLAVFGAIVAGFLGLTLATSDNAHLRPAFMDFVLGKHETTAVRVGDVISAVFFFGAAVTAWSFVTVSMDYQDKAPVSTLCCGRCRLFCPTPLHHAALSTLSSLGTQPSNQPQMEFTDPWLPLCY
jgi:TRAP-type C4-dicarboxylate transport system permease small subunit